MGLFSFFLCKNTLSIFLNERGLFVYLTRHGNAACPGCCWVPAVPLTDYSAIVGENLGDKRMNTTSPGLENHFLPLRYQIHSLNCSKKTSTLDFWESVAVIYNTIIYKDYWLRGQNTWILPLRIQPKESGCNTLGPEGRTLTASWTSRLSEHSPPLKIN